ncbi:jg9399 [Pararge aegeria aegeria]|uniref:Jg9399 protein n=1 Tax=Pararge aegeria aegeria TaxID=348720 RepID=A0A8S4S1P8_9NEOP|nr:jg9399 [Pararge aegeria aegeria]
MDVSTGGVSYDSGKLVRGGGAPRYPYSVGLSDSGGKKLLLNGRARRERGRAGVGGTATWFRLSSAARPAAFLTRYKNEKPPVFDA